MSENYTITIEDKCDDKGYKQVLEGVQFLKVEYIFADTFLDPSTEPPTRRQRVHFDIRGIYFPDYIGSETKG